jgi:hypothetical protein
MLLVVIASVLSAILIPTMDLYAKMNSVTIDIMWGLKTDRTSRSAKANCDGFIDGCMSVDVNTQEVCEYATDA